VEEEEEEKGKRLKRQRPYPTPSRLLSAYTKIAINRAPKSL